jgi:hypothetical protein
MKYHLAVISHNRPNNVKAILGIVGDAVFYVNIGERKTYLNAGAKKVVEAGNNICDARNRAIMDAGSLPCVQVSDDLKGIKEVSMVKHKRVQKLVEFDTVVGDLIRTLKDFKLYYGGVAVTNNPLNYVGVDYSYDKLIVNDLVCIMPNKKPVLFDLNMALKEDYDLCIRQLIEVGGVIRVNKYLCNFPHRENKGGANTYRNDNTEAAATKKLMNKWGPFIQPHRTRAGQVSLNYSAIRAAREQLLNQIKK